MVKLFPTCSTSKSIAVIMIALLTSTGLQRGWVLPQYGGKNLVFTTFCWQKWCIVTKTLSFNSSSLQACLHDIQNE